MILSIWFYYFKENFFRNNKLEKKRYLSELSFILIFLEKWFTYFNI